MERNMLIPELIYGVNGSPKRACLKDLLQAIESKPFKEVKGMIEERKRSIRLFNVGFKALVKALKLEKVDVANCLLDNKCRVNLEKKADASTTTPLHLAVKIGDPKLVDRLLEANASVLAVNENGDTPLHLAFLHGAGEIMDQILLKIQEKSKYVNMRNKMGLTHVHIACSRPNSKVIKGFLDQTVLTMSPVASKKKLASRKAIKKNEC